MGAVGAAEDVTDGALEELVRLGEQPWRTQRRCSGVSARTFFPRRGEPTEVAKAVCHDCAVRGECLADALERGERAGIWGGYSEDERRQLRRRYRGLSSREIAERLGYLVGS